MKIITLLVESAVAPFWELFGKFGLLFIPTSGSTARIAGQQQQRNSYRKKVHFERVFVLDRWRCSARHLDTVFKHGLTIGIH